MTIPSTDRHDRVRPIYGAPITSAERKNTSTNASDRLVEYFVMVSTEQVAADEVDGKARPPETNKGTMDTRSSARYEARRAHLVDQPDLIIDDRKPVFRLATVNNSLSTSSTCSSAEDFDLPLRKYESSASMGKDELIPSKVFVSHNDTKESNHNIEVLKDYFLNPVITARYPREDRPDQPLNPMLPQFCHPHGTGMMYPSTEYKMPRIHHFVLTDSKGEKLYGTCLTVYEEFTPQDDGASEESKEIGKNKPRYYAPRVLCLLSTWPYLTAFRTYLTQLYRLATATDVMEAPIERYIQNICLEVPAPKPGAFEVQLSILDVAIRFWAPPAQQPIAYVSLPFKMLFECLDISNIMYTWYTLACERKVLLVSDQLSLLTVCSEILCSLLFPMRWSHLYIPVLPRSLSPMLDAPMPYLCGIRRENFAFAVGDTGDETVVVDLDRNVISVGPNTPDLPPLPHKRRVKLEAALEKNVGHVFWNTRGVPPIKAESILRSGDEKSIKEMKSKANSLWHERIRSVDEAFNLAHAPGSTSILYNDDAKDASEGLAKQSRWDAVQEAFLRFYVAALKEYRKFIPQEARSGQHASWRGQNGKPDFRFQSHQFVLSQRRDFQPFLKGLVSTQQFDDFITKRIYNSSNEADVVFFDKSIDAKKNRSVLKIKKTDTTFLHSASAQRELQQYKAIAPTSDGVPSSASSKVGSKGLSVYQYPTWPEQFDESLFCVPRPMPKDIVAEFKRTITLSGGRTFVMPRDPHGEWR
ncbi:hypothetical protein THAPSDRAFT_8075 [Thalassiosira pseudonana CCMP1335]|uniref:UDENN domain-containing protein n=1 Tax=Thalassiosira pseudonana TaxID=35128 RepID=B8C8C1_THAPS|nr:hypothetical protein THAPSDRAFT_8075 [Thalassiosira pseudonana CCMP1335]EED90263.1 hypothetical protein THAPSDRAFT_8075 [Thalassiosira pseudonana CCMP1335]